MKKKYLSPFSTAFLYLSFTACGPNPPHHHNSEHLSPQPAPLVQLNQTAEPAVGCYFGTENSTLDILSGKEQLRFILICESLRQYELGNYSHQTLQDLQSQQSQLQNYLMLLEQDNSYPSFAEKQLCHDMIQKLADAETHLQSLLYGNSSNSTTVFLEEEIFELPGQSFSPLDYISGNVEMVGQLEDGTRMSCYVALDLYAGNIYSITQVEDLRKESNSILMELNTGNLINCSKSTPSSTHPIKVSDVKKALKYFVQFNSPTRKAPAAAKETPPVKSATVPVVRTTPLPQIKKESSTVVTPKKVETAAPQTSAPPAKFQKAPAKPSGITVETSPKDKPTTVETASPKPEAKPKEETLPTAVATEKEKQEEQVGGASESPKKKEEIPPPVLTEEEKKFFE